VPLEWSGAPAGTQSFALVVDDPDAPGGTFFHWALWNVPAATQSLPEDYPTDPEVDGTRQGTNDFGDTGFGPPCPPPGHGPHRYRFKLFALGTEGLDLPAGARCADVEKAAAHQAIERTELVGTYER
jgi:Raf kinase inhibitor-like YbhB/YbcL family protein